MQHASLRYRATLLTRRRGAPAGNTAKPGLPTLVAVFSVTLVRVPLLYTTLWVTAPAQTIKGRGGKAGLRRGGRGVSWACISQQTHSASPESVRMDGHSGFWPGTRRPGPMCPTTGTRHLA